MPQRPNPSASIRASRITTIEAADKRTLPALTEAPACSVMADEKEREREHAQLRSNDMHAGPSAPAHVRATPARRTRLPFELHCG